MAMQECKICHDEFKVDHSHVDCINSLVKQLAKSKAEVLSWRDAWFKQREITGKLAWEIPYVNVLKACQSPELQRQFKIFLQYAKEFLDRPALPANISVREEVDPFNNFEE